MTNNPRYTLGTEANRIFMASETYELLKFRQGLPSAGWRFRLAERRRHPRPLPRRRNVDHQPYGPCVFDWCHARIPGCGRAGRRGAQGLDRLCMTTSTAAGIRRCSRTGTHAPGKVCYAHAFVILAASSALLAGRPGAKELLDEALARMTSISGMTKSVWPSIPEYDSPSSTRTVVSTPTCTPPRHSWPWPTPPGTTPIASAPDTSSIM